MTACGSERPLCTSSSSALSKRPESLVVLSITGWIFSMSSPKVGDANIFSRANIQFSLPRKVLISPLWQTNR